MAEEKSAKRAEGSIKWFNTRKGFGFIKGDDGEDYFVHYTALPEGARVNENDRVTFEPTETDKGKQAQKVELVEEEQQKEEQQEEAA